ncbi:lipoate--protein ligase family protein [Candidatus Woesearchaeota archaeon]|nr:lipoate--protein ligase family protein [Candidatus Woesearchaeota archaeon]
MNIRCISLQQHNAAMNMALDEALTESIGSGVAPATLRFYTWSPPAISIGYFQSLTEEVDSEECKKNKIDLVRRMTGGGAVFHDKEITYSFIVKENNPLIHKDLLKSYQHICGAIVYGLSQFGLGAEFAPINDILVGGKKISGNAQTRKNKCILQHGTLLLDVDVDNMFSLLKVPNEKLKGKLIAEVKERVTSMRHCLGRLVTPEEMQQALLKGFQKTFPVPFFDGTISPSELQKALMLKTTKYLNRQWLELR